MATPKFRKEKDSLGYVKVPVDAFWAAQTQEKTTPRVINKSLVKLDMLRLYFVNLFY